MRLSQHTDYALRVLLYLQGVERRATIDEVAEAFGISRTHLKKVATALAAGGFLEAVRGRQGGVSLARAPEQIRLGDVVRHTEPSFEIVECFQAGSSRCVLTGGCALESALGGALQAFLDHLDGFTLANLALSPQALRGALGVATEV